MCSWCVHGCCFAACHLEAASIGLPHPQHTDNAASKRLPTLHGYLPLHCCCCCTRRYCGGCNAACLTRDAPCANGKARRPCMGTANRCILAKFGWGITCVPDQCDDCAARAVGPCKPGWFVNWELAACRFCPKGFACAGGSNTMVTAPPKPCNGGKFADKRGLSQCRQCPAGTTTPAVPANRGYAACVPEK
jgi:hypothetical protein